MPSIDPSAIIRGRVELADDVHIGPQCVLDGETGPIRIGAGTRLMGHAYLTGPLTLGERNTIYPFVTLGFAPQDLKWKPEVAGAGLVIGSDNVFREHVTIHRATSHEQPSVIGNANYFMAASHAGHDVRVANNCIFANGTLLAGFVQVDDRVITGGTAVVHQFCRIGRGAMLSGAMGTSMDLPPFFMLTGTNTAGSINIIGMRRSGMPRAEIDTVKWIYRTLCRSGLSRSSMLQTLRTRADEPLVREFILFVEQSKRGICPGTGKAARSSASMADEID